MFDLYDSIPGLNKSIERDRIDLDNLGKYGESISHNMMHTTIQGHNQQFSEVTLDRNGDKLANYSILALDQDLGYQIAWTFRMVELNRTMLQNCSHQEMGCLEDGIFLSESFAKKEGFQITWPGNCENRIYMASAFKRMGKSM